jgi:hypothetical protein
MSLRSGKLPFLGSDDEFFDHRGSKQVSPLLEIGTMGLTRRGLETNSRFGY